jgi:transposase InsO family protein
VAAGMHEATKPCLLGSIDHIQHESRSDYWDNAPVESFFATLKRERVHHRNYETQEEARTDLFQYLEPWYNRRRPTRRWGT